MAESLKRFSRAELRRLKPGDWVAWGRTAWHNHPLQPDFAFWKGRVIAFPERSGHHVRVLLKGVPHTAPKNRLYRLMPVIAIEDMHQQYDYNA